MIAAQFLWGSVLFRGELQKYAKNSNFENFESALYSTSGSMPSIWQAATWNLGVGLLWDFFYNFWLFSENWGGGIIIEHGTILGSLW